MTLLMGWQTKDSAYTGLSQLITLRAADFLPYCGKTFSKHCLTFLYTHRTQVEQQQNSSSQLDNKWKHRAILTLAKHGSPSFNFALKIKRSFFRVYLWWGGQPVNHLKLSYSQLIGLMDVSISMQGYLVRIYITQPCA